MKNDSIVNKIVFRKVEDDLKVLELADILLQGLPLCVQFDDCPEEQATKVLYFLSGVNYATDGNVKKLGEKAFLFALKEHFKLDEMKSFIEGILKNAK